MRIVEEMGAAFDAIAAGRQRMATFVTTLAELQDPRSWFHAIVDAAYERSLVVTLFHDANAKLGTAIHVFIGAKEEIWRVPALIAAHETGFVDGVWSQNAEARRDALLGISEARTRTRLAGRPPGELVYAALDETQLARVDGYGGRSLGTAAEVQGTSIARRPLVRRNKTLVRIPVRSVDGLLGRKPSLTLSKRDVAHLHAAMIDRVQVQTEHGWR